MKQQPPPPQGSSPRPVPASEQEHPHTQAPSSAWSRPPRTPFRRFMRRMLVTLAILVGLSFAALGFLAWLYHDQVVVSPSPELERGEILKRIAQESPIYYSDGTHKLGVFFGAEHRQYVKYAEIPEDFRKAIVASEDARFWDHPGIDVMGIARAMLANLKAGRVVAGGSTITQQTAKNLYDRNGRTLGAKLEELRYALKLEARYEKAEILEFYVNQFHVHSNGRGLGIAARYFFDKTVGQLTTLECAFLAGVVKGPFRYNPFVGATEEARARARARAKARTAYVLDRMVINGSLTPAKAEELKQQELPFKEGEFKYDHNVILDYVFSVLQEEPYTALLQAHGIDNPATAGISVITTIDREWQQAAEYGMRHNLSVVGAMLEGLTLDAFLGPQESLMPVSREDIIPYGFLEGVVIAPVTEGPDAPALKVDLGGVEALVDKNGLDRVADLLKRAADASKYANAKKSEVLAMLESFPPGRKVYVSVKKLREDGTPVVDLEATTQLQGALVVLEQGRIRAMVGGQDNRNFNRAATARRQLGSTWKPLTFASALSLGWSPLSPIDNRRQAFSYQGQFYWPRFDHEPDAPFMSMAWSGASSENLASVSLLYHLTDLLSEVQLLELAEHVGLGPGQNEAPDAYLTRIRDKAGIVPTDESLEEGIYESLKGSLKAELVAAGRVAEARALTWLPYGRGFDGERAKTDADRAMPLSERLVRTKFLARGVKQLEALAPEAQAAIEVILRGIPTPPSGITGLILPALGSDGTAYSGPQASAEDLQSALKRFYLWNDGGIDRLVYATHPDEGWRRATLEETRRILQQGSGVGLPARLDVPGVRLGPDGTPTRGIPVQTGASSSFRAVTGEGGTGSGTTLSGPATVAGGGSTSGGATAAGSGSGLAGTGLAGTGLTGSPGSGERLADGTLVGPVLQPSLPAIVPSRKPETHVLLEGQLSLTSLTEIREQINSRLLEASTWAPFSLKRLIHHKDFRVLVGMMYVIQLAQNAGVRSPMKPVLSMTLGANDITLLEAAMLYQTLLTGQAYAFSQTERPEAGIIAEIRDSTGGILYQAEEKRARLLDPSVGAQMGRILRGVVERGTAARARGALRLSSPDAELEKKLARLKITVPFMGKTGTTNDYLNVAFLGFLPKPEGPVAELPYDRALTIASYVGYDDNRPMKRGSIRIQGSSGALPAWLDTAQGILRDLDAGATLPLKELRPGGELPIRWAEGMQPVAVERLTGLRSGLGVVGTAEAPVPEGRSSYEVFGLQEGDAFLEREAFLPFTSFSKAMAESLQGALTGAGEIPVSSPSGSPVPSPGVPNAAPVPPVPAPGTTGGADGPLSSPAPGTEPGPARGADAGTGSGSGKSPEAGADRGSAGTGSPSREGAEGVGPAGGGREGPQKEGQSAPPGPPADPP